MTTEINAGRRFGRREALSFVGLGGIGLLLYFRLREGSEHLDNLKKEAIPIIKGYLEEDLKSDSDDNLTLFSALGKNAFLKTIKERNNDLISDDQDVRSQSRWQILRILGEDVLKIPLSDKDFNLGTTTQLLNFIQDTAGGIDKNLILSSKLEVQASMWTEAIMRSYSFMGVPELPRPDGVTTAKNYTLLGDRGIQFFRLQDHSSVKLSVK